MNGNITELSSLQGGHGQRTGWPCSKNYRALAFIFYVRKERPPVVCSPLFTNHTGRPKIGAEKKQFWLFNSHCGFSAVVNHLNPLFFREKIFAD
jgi:hypothetical protein